MPSEPGRPPIIQYWHATPPPASVTAAFRSFTAHNPDLAHMMFDEGTAGDFIEQHFSTRHRDAFRACTVPAMQSDYFRYCALSTLGGIYADADLECLKSVQGLLGGSGLLVGSHDVTGSGARFFGWPDETVGPYRVINNKLIAFPGPRHPLLSIAIDVATSNIHGQIADGPLGVWLTTGPGIFTSMYLLHRLGSIDAFVDYVAGSALEVSATPFCEVVEDPQRIDRALDGVAIRALDECIDTWISPIEVSRSERSTWQTVRGSIFRQPKDHVLFLPFPWRRQSTDRT